MSKSDGQHWVLASSNPGKIREFEHLLGALRVRLIPQGALGIADAEEPHPTFVENALAKARHASRLSGLPGLADDSGLCVPALGGAPGVHSARYAALRDGDGKGDDAGTASASASASGSGSGSGVDTALLAQGRAVVDPANNRKLVAALDALRGASGSRQASSVEAIDRAWYYCVIVFVRDASDPCPVIAEGLWTGRIVAEPRGDGGFGYDPHFLVDGENMTAAEMTAVRKNAISHRAIALRRLLAALEQR